VAGTVAAATVLSGCTSSQSSSNGDGGGSVASGGTFTFGAIAAPPSLNPALSDPAYNPVLQWAYDPLVVLQPDGEFGPGLAEEFGYVGEGNRTYELTLREGVQFSDGTDLDAEALKTYLDYLRAQPSSAGLLMINVESVEVVDPLTVRINLKASDPGLTFAFAQGFGAGNIASPDAVASPETLDTETAGAGPYMVDPERSVAGDSYTFVKNPNYWNPERQHWDEVVVRVIANPSSMIQAIQAGQVQAAQGDPTTLSAAEDAGLTVVSAPQTLTGLNLADRGGQLSEPLGDVRVRQALNLAVDREAVAEALYGDADLALAQYALEGHAGHDESLDETNAYDPDRARELLEEAGYGDGFTLPVLDTSLVGLHTMTEAVGGQLAEVGVTLEITTQAQANDYFTDMVSAKFPAIALGYGLANMQSLYVGFVQPQAPFNPFKTSDPELDALYAEYFAASEEESADVQQRINARLVEQGWALPVVGAPLAYYLEEGLTGIEATTGNSAVPTFADIRPAD
jgi:peptide/nickel transport system substrate-binding protein